MSRCDAAPTRWTRCNALRCKRRNSGAGLSGRYLQQQRAHAERGGGVVAQRGAHERRAALLVGRVDARRHLLVELALPRGHARCASVQYCGMLAASTVLQCTAVRCGNAALAGTAVLLRYCCCTVWYTGECCTVLCCAVLCRTVRHGARLRKLVELLHVALRDDLVDGHVDRGELQAQRVRAHTHSHEYARAHARTHAYTHWHRHAHPRSLAQRCARRHTHTQTTHTNTHKHTQTQTQT